MTGVQVFRLVFLVVCLGIGFQRRTDLIELIGTVRASASDTACRMRGHRPAAES